MDESDFLIRNARLYDGSGGEAFLADVALRGSRITDVRPAGSPGHSSGRRLKPGGTFDAEGKTLAPGFIDVHSHSDISLLAAPEAFGKISQGVTTEIVGNCGLSVFPVLSEEVRAHLNELYRDYGEKITWDGLEGYASEMERRGVFVNVASLCGHNTLRASIAGYEDVPLEAPDLLRMRAALRGAFQSGAAGFSTGLLYIPGKFSTEEELLSLMRELREEDAVYATHLRNEGDFLEEALDEALRLARAGSGRLQISHLKTALPENWHKLPSVLERIGNARREGLSVHADRYPYTFGQTSLSVILPPPYDKMTDSAIREALSRDPSACDSLRSVLDTKRFWDGIILTSSSLREYEPLFGLPMPQAAEKAGMTPAALTVELMRKDAPAAMAAFGGLSPENLRSILSRPWVCCGSDENARPRDYSLGRSHPRAFGSFPKFLRMVAETEGMAEAVRRVSSLPCSIFRIAERGLVRPGYFADLTLFDETELQDRADFVHPHRPADGILAVWVNGVLSYAPSEGAVPGKAGRFLKFSPGGSVRKAVSPA